MSGGGREHTTLKFFATTNPNQFPIRQITIDWGDDIGGGTWGGTLSEENYYKAARGLDSNGNQYCDYDSEWGLTAESCDTGYYTFTKDYVCTEGMLAALQNDNEHNFCDVGTDANGQIQVYNSPCLDSQGDVPGASGMCVFQPRVFIKDNWGYCTGVCTGEPGGDYCYDDSDSVNPPAYNECNLDCPDDENISTCPKGYGSPGNPNVANPWIYYDGVIMVSPD